MARHAHAPRTVRRAATRLLQALAALVLLALLPARAHAARVANRLALPLTITQVSDTALTLDSNSPLTGPRAQYVAYRVTNTSGAALANLTATISGFAGGVALAGGQAATQYVGALAAGASATLYWFVTYPATFNVRNVLTVTVSDGTAGGTASGSAPVRTLSMLSSQGGGQAGVSSIPSSSVVGLVVPLDVTFAFKGWKAGDSFNLQPAGNNDFSAGCFQLVSSTILSTDAGLSTSIPAGTANRQYFTAVVASPGGGSTWSTKIRYYFRYRCANVGTTPLPYSNEIGGSNLMYSSSYGTGSANPGPFPSAPNVTTNFTVTKTVSAAQLTAGATVTYTVRVTNASSYNVTLDSIVDVLPAGAIYGGLAAGSQVTAANSGSVPAAGSTGALVFRGQPNVSYALDAGTTLTLVYTVAIPSTAGQYVNGAAPYVGPTALGSASATVTVGTADLSIVKTGPASVVAGDTARYVIATTNAGPSTAYQVVVRDTLPSGMTFVRASRGATASAGVVVFPAAASLANGATLSDTVFALAPAALGPVTNVAAAGSASYDPAPTNNDGSNPAARATASVTMPVAVTPDGGAPIARLPGTRYAQPFVVQNLGPVPATYALRAAALGTTVFLAIDSITGAGLVKTARADSAQVTMAARATGTYTVWYTIPAGDTLQNVERLRATNVSAVAYTDTGWVAIRRGYPALAIAKTASAATVQPGADLTYTVTFRNAGGYDATGVVVTDQVPAQVIFKLGSLGQTLVAGITTTVAYSNDAGVTWTYTPTSGGCGAPAGYDACVTRVRWTVAGALPPLSSESALTFVARIR